MRWRVRQGRTGAERVFLRRAVGFDDELGGEWMSSELSQSTIRVRNDARGRVRRESRNREHVVHRALFERLGPAPPVRGQSLWTALALPGHGRESLGYMMSTSLSALEATRVVDW